MKGLIGGLVLVAFILLRSGDSPLNAQSIKGKSIRTHSLKLTKKKNIPTGSDSIPLICFLSLCPYNESSEKVKSAFDFLQSVGEYKSEFVRLKDFRKKKKTVNRFSAIWIHRPDTTELSAVETTSDLLNMLKSYIAQGGKVLLTQQAFHYINELGLESAIPRDSTKLCLDEGYGRKLGVHSFRGHPMFNGLNGGAYLLRPQRDMTTRIIGFFGNSKPAEGKVVAADWDYIFIREESKLILEYNFNKGMVIAVGGYIDFVEGNINRQHLELFIRNSFRYLTSKDQEDKKWYWDYSPNRVYQDTCRIAIAPVIKTSSGTDDWNDKNEALTLARESASGNYFEVAGERLLTMGTENGGIEEVWSHPFMAFRDYETGICFGDRDTIFWLNNEHVEIEVHPGYFLRKYTFPGAFLKEIIVNDPVAPAGVVHYEYKGLNKAEIILKFRTNFRWMWPYSDKVTGSISYSWDSVSRAFIFQDKSKDLNLIIGCSRKPLEQISGQFEKFSEESSDRKIVGIPTSEFTASSVLRYSLSDSDTIDLIYCATNEGLSKTAEIYQKSVSEPYRIFENAVNHVNELVSNRLMVTSPDLNFNKGYRWALIGTNRFMVNTPGMGKSLVAGYSTTRRGWDGGHKVNGRPGYGWYFGRDGEWSGLALLDYGDYEKVKSELIFFNKYQDLTGKIFHEATTSGFIHYDASDATPLYILLAGRYFRFSNDTAFIRKTWPNIKKAIDFCFSTDTDHDHLIENTNVGHGWVEGGELYGSHATLYMAGCWSAALAEAKNMALFVGDQDAWRYGSESEMVKTIINTDFWDARKQFYSYGKNRDGSFRNDPTILPAIPMYFKLAEKDKAGPVLRQYASNPFSTNWGTRIVRDDSPYFNPRGYHYGSVWPLFTGWCSLAEYAYGNYHQGFTHLMNNLNVYKQWGLGFVEEVINGSGYEPSGVCPHQCWSETMVLQPAIEGLLGLDINAPENKVILSPRIPANWDSLKVDNIRIAEKSMSYIYSRKSNIIQFRFTLIGGSHSNIHFMPFFSAGTQFREVKLNGNDVPFTGFSTQQSSALYVPFELKGEAVIDVETARGISVVPVVNDPKPGSPSAGLRILSAKLSGKEYVIELEGTEETNEVIQVYCSDHVINRIENGTLIRKNGPIVEVGIDFPSGGQKYAQKTLKVIVN